MLYLQLYKGKKGEARKRLQLVPLRMDYGNKPSRILAHTVFWGHPAVHREFASEEVCECPSVGRYILGSDLGRAIHTCCYYLSTWELGQEYLPRCETTGNQVALLTEASVP